MIKTLGLSTEEKLINRIGFLQILQGACGTDVEVCTTKSSASLTGVLHTATAFEGMQWEYILKAVRSSDKDPKILENTLQIESESVVSLKTNKIEHLIKKSQATNEFQTDSSIRTKDDIAKLHGRQLQSIGDGWLSSEVSTDFDKQSKANIHWDQFEVNKTKFGIKSTFDENVTIINIT